MIEDLYNVKDKVAIVTGSSRGIGKQCALAFAEAGAKLVLNYVSNKQAAEITAEEVVDPEKAWWLARAVIIPQPSILSRVITVEEHQGYEDKPSYGRFVLLLWVAL